MSAISGYLASRPLNSVGAAPATTGVTATGFGSAGSPASRTGTGYDPTPVGGPAPAATPAVSRMVSEQFGGQLGSDFAAASGGGAISDALTNGVAKIAAFAQNGMKRIQDAIQSDMTAGNGHVDPAKLQQYTMQMTNYELMNQLAAKIQEKQDAAIRAWLR